jgi:hypothetical protein
MSVAVQKTEPPTTETLPPGMPTKLKRPEEKAIRSFKSWMIGADRICCRHCPRTIEMKPEAIEEKFGAYRGLRLVDLLPKLTCGQNAGCGSTDMVLFPWKEPATDAKPNATRPRSGDLF